MKRLSDNEIIDELKRRLEESRRALHDIEGATRRLETVNRKLQESEALKSNFLSNIRNEINNPLSSIMALSEQIMKGDIEAAMVPDMAALIFSETFELDYQLKNIFIAAELEAGESAMSVARLDLDVFVHHLLRTFDHRIKAKKLQVEIDCGGGPDCENVEFKTDPEKLQAIMVNLLGNAIEYSHEGKRIRISAQVADGKLTLSVRDEGPGIANEHSKQVFDRFAQGETGSRKSHKGHGLGLSIVKALVDIMGGYVTLKSTVGEGCEFIVIVPEVAGAPDDVFSVDGNELIFDADEEF